MIDQQKQNYIDKLNKELSRIIFIEENDSRKSCKANVCCVCDRLLRCNDSCYIAINKLEQAKDTTLRIHKDYDSIHENIKSKLSSYYTYNGKFSESWMGENNVLVGP